MCTKFVRKEVVTVFSWDFARDFHEVVNSHHSVRSFTNTKTVHLHESRVSRSIFNFHHLHPNLNEDYMCYLHTFLKRKTPNQLRLWFQYKICCFKPDLVFDAQVQCNCKVLKIHKNWTMMNFPIFNVVSTYINVLIIYNLY